LGCLQAWFGGAGEARGTWPNRNHYASFLAMCLPFPAMYGIASLQNSRLPGRRRLSPVVVACMAFFTVALLLLGIVESLSRMGFTAAIFSLFVAGIAVGGKPNKWTSSARRRLAVAGALLAIVVVAFLFLAPAQLISRFDQLEFSNGITTEDRFQLWHESLALVRAYPVFGTGLGGYESVFLQHKVSSPMVSDKFAHNDYLQYFIELGAIGFVLAAVALASVLFGACRTLSHPSAEHRAMAAACCGSFAAILLHSAVDFNLQIPANQFLLAWVAGLASASSLRYSPLPMDVPAARPLRRAPVEVPARTSIVSLSMSAWSKGNQPQTPQEV
jgi:O-antigen ligase